MNLNEKKIAISIYEQTKGNCFYILIFLFFMQSQYLYFLLLIY
jgi:hypothetical protein